MGKNIGLEEGVWPHGLHDGRGGKKADILKLVCTMTSLLLYSPPLSLFF